MTAVIHVCLGLGIPYRSISPTLSVNPGFRCDPWNMSSAVPHSLCYNSLRKQTSVKVFPSKIFPFRKQPKGFCLLSAGKTISCAEGPIPPHPALRKAERKEKDCVVCTELWPRPPSRGENLSPVCPLLASPALWVQVPAASFPPPQQYSGL